jgi:hypothetical protein
VSDISSAGSNGKTCRQDVLCGVDVPVVPGAAGRALPRPDLQAELGQDMPACRAHLRAGEPPVDHDHPPPAPGRLVLQHAPEGAPSAVRDRLRQPAVADHVLDREVFHADQVIIADQAGAGLVEEVVAGSANLAVCPGDFLLGFGTVGAALLAAGQPPLVAAQVLGPAFQVPGVGDPLLVAGDHKVLDPQVNPDNPASGGKRPGVGDLDGERHVPAAARVPGHRHRRRVDRGGINAGPGPGERQRRAHLGQIQRAVAPPKPGPGVLGRLPTVAGFEPRVPGALGKERCIRGLLVPKRLLQRDAGHLVQPRQFVRGLQSGQVGAGLAVARPGLVCLISLAAPGQGPVPHDADAAERAV